MNYDCRAVNGKTYFTLIFILCLLVFMGLLLVENALFEYGNMAAAVSPFPRFQLPAPGKYCFYYRERKIELSWLVKVGKLRQDERGFWLQVGSTEVYCPTSLILFSQP